MDQEQTPQERARELVSWLVPTNWRPTERQVLWAIRIAIVLGVLIAVGYTYGITLWDWAQLLIIPAVIAGGGIWFNQRQQEREVQIADQRAQDEALQAYLDNMSQLILDWKLGEDARFTTHRAAPLAQARTSTVILSLDAEHNESVTRFLSTSKLTWSSTTAPVPGIREFPEGILTGIALSDAKLSGAWLRYADLSIAVLSGADLSNAILTGANLSNTILTGAVLHGANLSDADLSDAFLRGALLMSADLSEANLKVADLSDANLSGANLSYANLSYASGITNEELEQKAKSLEGATMPNGQMYEEWLKSRDREEDAENTGP